MSAASFSYDVFLSYSSQDKAIVHPLAEQLKDAETLAAIEEGVAQLDKGEGYPIEELHRELARRCSK